MDRQNVSSVRLAFLAKALWPLLKLAVIGRHGLGYSGRLVSKTVVGAVIHPHQPAPHLQVLLPDHDAVDGGSVWEF